MVLELHRNDHLDILAHWLRHAHTIMGMNLLFDVPYIRFHPKLRFLLQPSTHYLIDLSIINYLHSEVRRARSLKTLGPVLGTHSYDPETQLGDDRYPSPLWKSKSGLGLHEYNAADSHNTVLGISELPRRILIDHPNSSKLGPSCLLYYNHVLWSSIRMLESGIPMSRPRLITLRSTLLATQEKASQEAKEFGLILSGKDSVKSKNAFINSLIPEIDACAQEKNPTTRTPTPSPVFSTPSSSPSSSSPSSPSPPSSSTISPSSAPYSPTLNHPLLKRTDKKEAISWGDENRILFQLLLPPDHPRQSHLACISRHSKAQKLIGSYITPLLDHQANDPTNQKSVLLGPGPVGIGYPTIYVCPTQAKDDSSSDEGGQQQGRISFKNPSAQTFPPAIKECFASRYGSEGCIISWDASQIELRGAALQSGEPSLLRAFSLNQDLHTLRAIDVFGHSSLLTELGPSYESHPTFKKKHRQCAKHGNFTDLNWGSPHALQRVILKKGNTLVPFSLCAAVVASRQSTRPVLYDWQLRTLAEARSTGYVHLPITGHSRTFTGLVQSDDTNEVVNFPIQCFAASVTLRLQSFLDWHLPHPLDPRTRCHLFLNTYDALTFDTHLSYLSALRTLIAEGVNWLITKDLWHLAQLHYGRECPLRYDETIHT